MEIEDPPTTIQEHQVPKVAILDAPLIMETNSEHASMDADYGSEELPLFGK
jgi:hypothetical protein